MVMFRMPALALLYLLVLPTIIQCSLEVVWNILSGQCLKKKPKVDIPLDKFNISHNKGLTFFGDKIVLFYEKHFGLCPYYNNSKPDQPVNGGLPQNVSIVDHLAKVVKDIRKEIPDRNFNGLAVIDLEEWRPLFKMNWGKQTVYRKQSVALVRSKYPNIPQKEALQLAEEEFNRAARIFFVWTLRIARSIRPKAHWGYYDYPFCNSHAGDKPNEYTCNKQAKQYNDELDFIYRTSTGLFPSIYLNGNKTEDQDFRFVQAFIEETRRVAEKRNPPLSSSYIRSSNMTHTRTSHHFTPRQINRINVSSAEAFNWHEVIEVNHIQNFSIGDLCNTMKQPVDLGANGLVLWSTSKNMKNRCKLISNYVGSELGPTLVDIRENFTECRRVRCSDSGTCVLRKPAKTCKFDFIFADYVCRCDRGYRGDNCSLEYKNNPS